MEVSSPKVTTCLHQFSEKQNSGDGVGDGVISVYALGKQRGIKTGSVLKKFSLIGHLPQAKLVEWLSLVRKNNGW